MSGILWLASYPKSGNTWLRAFITNYMRNPAEPTAINDLRRFNLGDGLAEVFERVAGRPARELSTEDIQRLRPKVHKMFAESGPATVFVKTHNAFAYIDDIPTITPELTAGAVYVIRNPLDVAVSYSHHNGITTDRAVEAMGNQDTHQPTHGNQIVQFISSWSAHVRSWLTAPGLNPFVMRYEDMHRKPDQVFRRLLQFIQVPIDKQRLTRAISFSSFKTLSAQEKATGFVETSPASDGVFFRKGKIGAWREELTAGQAERLIADHREVMAEHGYLDAAGQPVF